MTRSRSADKRSRSLRSVLLLQNAAFLFLVAVTSALGVYGSWYWKHSSQQSLQLNALLNDALEIRGDIFREIKAITTARLVNDQSALDRYWRHLYQIDQRFYRIEKQLADDTGAAAVATMRRSYELMQSAMNRAFAAGDSAGYAAIRQLTDDAYRQHILGDFESAFEVLRKHVRQRQGGIEAALQRWSRLAPFGVGIPVLLALGLLLYSRHVFRDQFVQPMGDLTAGALSISAGQLRTRVPVRGVQDVAALSESINTLAAQLAVSREALVERERQAALGALVPVVAHNIRNPLASIRATAQVMACADSAAERGEARQAITETVDRLERWVSALLCYLNPLQPARETVGFSYVIDQTLRALDTRLREKQLRLVRNERDNGILLDADEALLEQALYGLLINAVEASSAGGTIGIVLELRDRTATLLIDDEGPGMPFEPRPTDLSPGPSTKRFGTGLGIPFAVKIVKAHAGRINFESAPRGGTRVRLELPALAS